VVLSHANLTWSSVGRDFEANGIVSGSIGNVRYYLHVGLTGLLSDAKTSAPVDHRNLAAAVVAAWPTQRGRGDVPVRDASLARHFGSLGEDEVETIICGLAPLIKRAYPGDTLGAVVPKTSVELATFFVALHKQRKAVLPVSNDDDDDDEDDDDDAGGVPSSSHGRSGGGGDVSSSSASSSLSSSSMASSSSSAAAAASSSSPTSTNKRSFHLCDS
jgi:hypothetical protein